MKIAIIPARGGSKRIPRKNIKNFYGRPMIAHTIRTAIESDLFDRIIVSTDDTEIKEVAEQYGAEVPFTRPKLISGDYALTSEVLHHALKKIPCEYACCIYPCTPFLTDYDLEVGFNSLPSFAVKKYPASIERAFQKFDGFMKMVQPEHRDTRTQDLLDTFYDAGQFYWVNTKHFMSNPVLLNGTLRGIECPNTMDIDTPEDWRLAEDLYNVRNT